MWGEVGGYGVDSACVALSVTVRDISKTSWRNSIHFSQMDFLTITHIRRASEIQV